MKIQNIIFLFIAFFLSCGNKPTDSKANDPVGSDELNNTSNYLTMKIDGVKWAAESKVFASYDQQGYENQIIIGGDKNYQQDDQQTFNFIIYDASGTGEYSINESNKNVAQMSGWQSEGDLCGSLIGNVSMNLKVTKSNKVPSIMEATFSGTMACGDKSIISITDGKLYYHE